MNEHDLTFDAMGSHVRLLIGEPGPGLEPAAEAAERARRFVLDFDAALSRFKPESELCALNGDPRDRVPASELLRQAVRAGLGAAERSGGLVDPTLVREIEGAGYVKSRAGMTGLRPWRGAAAGAAAPRRARPTRGHAGAASKSTTRPARSCAHPGCASTPAAPARASPPTLSPPACAATRASSSTAAATSASAAPAPWSTPTRSSSNTRSAASAPMCCGSATAVSPPPASTSASGAAPTAAAPTTCSTPPAASPPGPAWSAPRRWPTPRSRRRRSPRRRCSPGRRAGGEVLAERGGLLVHDSGRVELVGPLAVAPRIRIPESPVALGAEQ